MNREYSEYSIDASEMEEDNIYSNEKLLSDNREYLKYHAAIQMQFKEKASYYTLEYSAFRFDDGNVNERTLKNLDCTPLEFGTSVLALKEIQQTEGHNIWVQKDVQRQINICVGFLAVVLFAMLTVWGFTLFHMSLHKERNVTPTPCSNSTDVSPLEVNTGITEFHKLANKYRILAEQGNTDAQYNLGLMFMTGRDVPQSYDEAAKWYRKAAEHGNTDAQYNLGVMFQEGKGVPQSYEEAVKWYRKAAEQGSALGQTYLGVMYQAGLGVPQSDKEAVKLYRQAAEQGNTQGQKCLALMYEKGRGVSQSDEEAVRWYRKAAEQGDADAQKSLEEMYKKGKVVPKSDEVTVKWYRKAAEQGNAQFRLAANV